VRRARMRKAGRSPLPGGEEGIMDASSISESKRMYGMASDRSFFNSSSM
jgi:hypothetical protein